MGCGGSSNKHDYTEDVGPDGPLDAAPARLLVTGHCDTAYNGIYTRADEWNGKAMYANGQRFLYYYNCGEDGQPGWSFDHRNQVQERGGRDWYAGGFYPMHGGPAFPPLVGNVPVVDPDDADGDVLVTITEVDVAMPPAAVRISDHPEEEANGVYVLGQDLWNARPHYHKGSWCFYFYARNEGGEPGWSLHSELVPHGARDHCDGGWVGPYIYSHPPLGDALGFNDVGRCSVRAEAGDAAVAAQVHALLVQHRQNLLQSFGQPAVAQPMMAQEPIVVAQPMMVQQPMVMAQPVMMQPAAPVVSQPVGPVVAQPLFVAQQ